MSSIPRSFAVISDTHFRSGRNGEHIDKYLKALDWCIKNKYVLYHAGDIVEGYDPKTSLDGLMFEVRCDIVDSIMNGCLVSGNHDNEIFGDGDAMDCIHDRRRKIIITHGQRFDASYENEDMESGNDFWGKLAYRMDLMRLDIVGSLIRNAHNIGFNSRAFSYMQENLLRLMICGHTHRPDIVTRDGMTLAIGGAWSETASDSQRKIVVVDGYEARLVGLEEM